MREHHYYDTAAKQTYSKPAFLTIVGASVRLDDHRPLKHLRSVLEIEAVLTDVGPVLGFIPLEIHTITACARGAVEDMELYVITTCDSNRSGETNAVIHSISYT